MATLLSLFDHRSCRAWPRPCCPRRKAKSPEKLVFLFEVQAQIFLIACCFSCYCFPYVPFDRWFSPPQTKLFRNLCQVRTYLENPSLNPHYLKRLAKYAQAEDWLPRCAGDAEAFMCSCMSFASHLIYSTTIHRGFRASYGFESSTLLQVANRCVASGCKT